jgi:hypothetical protein
MKNMIGRVSGAILTLGLTVWPVRAELEVSATVQIHAKADFEAPLAAQGQWVVVGSYGRCWRPGQVAVEWRPYGCGEWVWTDCGWYWQSDEPWAWACYHYGWWVYDTSFGWVWVPDVAWAPAWVSWRVGGGYIGWAPLPPPGWFFANHPKPELFVFVGAGKFGDPVAPRTLIVNTKLTIKGTEEIGGIKRESVSLGGASAQKAMVNHGPDVAMVQKASGKTVRLTSINDAVRRTAAAAPVKHAAADLHGHQDKPAAPAQWNHGPDHSGPGNGATKHEPDRDQGPDFGGNAGPSGGNGGGHGGGHGGHGHGGQ